MAEDFPTPDNKALFALVYQELRRLARGQRRRMGGAATLDTTALVHEAYLKLHDSPQVGSIDRLHFLSLAARAMRHVLVDHARNRSRIKRGGAWAQTTFGDAIGEGSGIVDLVALDAALNELSEVDARAGTIVELRVFSGLEIAEIARLQGVAERTVFRDWRRARAFLMQRLDIEPVVP